MKLYYWESETGSGSFHALNDKNALKYFSTFKCVPWCLYTETASGQLRIVKEWAH